MLFEAYPPLLIDSDTISTSAFTFEFLQSIVRRDTYILEANCIVYHTKFSIVNLLYVLGQLTRASAVEDFLSFSALERLDHVINV